MGLPVSAAFPQRHWPGPRCRHFFNKSGETLRCVTSSRCAPFRRKPTAVAAIPSQDRERTWSIRVFRICSEFWQFCRFCKRSQRALWCSRFLESSAAVFLTSVINRQAVAGYYRSRVDGGVYPSGVFRIEQFPFDGFPFFKGFFQGAILYGRF